MLTLRNLSDAVGLRRRIGGRTALWLCAAVLAGCFGTSPASAQPPAAAVIGVAAEADSGPVHRVQSRRRSAEDNECGRGKYLSDGHCCARGTAWNGKRCLRRPGLRPVCPRGTSGIYPDCQARSGQSCPSGTVGTFPNCRTARTCPSGMVGAPPNCRTIRVDRAPTRVCPPGTIGVPPVCRTKQARPCPAGTVGSGGRCLSLGSPRPQVQIRKPVPRINPPASPTIGSGANTRPLWR
jgi:hypothetical protein